MVQALFSKKETDFRQQEAIRGKIYRRKLIANNYSERRPIFVMQTIHIREKIVICHAMNKLKFKKMTTE